MNCRWSSRRRRRRIHARRRPGRELLGDARRSSLAKGISLHEQIRVEFRAEAFNVFNRVRFGTGSTSLQAQNFGVLTSNGDLLNTPRQLQLALKLYF
jgi:hypothetical protein